MAEYTEGEFKGMVIEKLNNIESRMIKFEKQKVDRDEFTPVKAITYGFVGIVMAAVIGALITTVIGAV